MENTTKSYELDNGDYLEVDIMSDAYFYVSLVSKEPRSFHTNYAPHALKRVRELGLSASDKEEVENILLDYMNARKSK